jgi:polysaccharide export outer membrane protein
MKASSLTVLLLLVSVLRPLAGQQVGGTSADMVVLQPGDALQVTIWREEELSGEFPVDSRGFVILPLLGERQVTVTAFGALREQLLAEYRQQLRNPSINLVPLRRVYVLGEVNKPGLYSVDPTISLTGVVALAEGATPAGDLRRIRVLRDGEMIVNRVAPERSLAAADVRSGDQVFVDRRGWFERNSTFLISATLSIPGIIATILALR